MISMYSLFLVKSYLSIFIEEVQVTSLLFLAMSFNVLTVKIKNKKNKKNSNFYYA
jgi:hypothetical protein